MAAAAHSEHAGGGRVSVARADGGARPAALDLRGVTKTYGAFRALDDVSVRVGEGEVVGLIGENGAGKSTLLNVICGAVRPDAGTLTVHGADYAPRSYRDAMRRGVFRVYQEPAFVPVLSVRENMALGVETAFTRGGLIRRGALQRAVEQALEPLAGLVSPSQQMSSCDRNTQQAIEILRALFASRLLGVEHPLVLLDEPTAALVGDDLAILFETLRRLRGEASFVFVSHRLAEINDYCDRAYVLKDGGVVAEVPAGTGEEELHRLMVGRERIADYYREGEQRTAADEVLLRVEDLAGSGFEGVDLTVHAGEIVGVAGVVGSGKEQLGRAIAGAAKTTRGRVEVTRAGGGSDRAGGDGAGGDGASGGGTPGARAGAVGYVPSDRQNEGAVELFSVAENVSLTSLAQAPIARGPFVDRRREREVAQGWVERLTIRTRSTDTPMGDLSGGNQQKVVLGRVLQTGVRAIVLDNPTRGVDAGAKGEIYALLRELAAEGHGIVLITDDLAEAIGLSSRIVVMKDGRSGRWFDAAPQAKPSEELLIAEMV
ncbi:sugar ABC transporter ATP-binding protein [Conexibacter sp. CPCC 206217]|uniref:sugar ABC transporter ATP-binding protein n=1 Tax=Conexibacter sp. CPCC 206217 TaxID=3064574 RepID=UPI0027222A3C|nr:sugar ABC transporter ATP-binding protein [Conexibacter sp. CPCC 206217]MDO8212287.1 sugar ABC transporter ATP-binding protein [Conexibacter sp. CPCC 206217]